MVKSPVFTGLFILKPFGMVLVMMSEHSSN